jgi:hypothetical protein
VQTELKMDTPFKSYSFFLKNICFIESVQRRAGASGCNQSLSKRWGTAEGLKPNERSGVVRGEVMCTIAVFGHVSDAEWGRMLDVRATGHGLSQSLLEMRWVAVSMEPGLTKCSPPAPSTGAASPPAPPSSNQAIFGGLR